VAIPRSAQEVVHVDEMDEIIEEFLVESHENLDRLDAEFVRLETTPDDVDVLAGIFRDIHTIKGTSGFLGYAKLESVAHVGENLLSKLRDRDLALTESRTSVLLAMVDAIRAILSSIESTRDEGDGDYTGLVARLEAACSDAPALAPVPPVADVPVATAAPAAAAEEATAQAAPETAPDPAAASEPDAQPTPSAPAPEPNIGEILARQSGVTEEQIAAATAAQDEGDPRHLGEILVAQGAVADAEVLEALKAQERTASSQAGRHAADATIRVDVDLLDNLMNLVGELVLARNQIMQFTGETSSANLIDTSQRLNLITTELQEGVMKTRMQPIGNVFSKFPRVVRDISLSLGKQVTVVMEGKGTELDKTIIEAIKDPLTHMVRNSVDHGIETPEVRRAAGKSDDGTLVLRAYHEGGQVNIEIADDGAGIDPVVIARKAVEKGVASAEAVARMSKREIVNLVFAPGFSTAETVSNISGRGVGMDVVRTSIERIGGSVDISSEHGKGTVTKIKIPLTLAIIPALIVEAGPDRFAIPQVSLLELVRLEDGELDSAVEQVHGTPVYRLRGSLLPLVYLDRLLGGTDERDGTVTNIVVLQADDQQFGLVVDGVSDTAEIVVKPLGQVLKGIATYAGATIMGDGRVALILDALGIAQLAGIAGSRHGGHTRAEVTSDAITDGQSLLIFGLGEPDAIGNDTRMAVPLAQVARLEEIAAERVEYAAGSAVIQYRDEILPLVWLSQALGVPSMPLDPTQTLQVIVYERGHGADVRRVGFVVDRISDVVEETLTIQRPSTTTGVKGSAVIGGKVTDVLDVEAIIAVHAPDLLTDTHTLEAV
jgi:two-component system, chemotaxis family, sensor kinase CheA